MKSFGSGEGEVVHRRACWMSRTLRLYQSDFVGVTNIPKLSGNMRVVSQLRLLNYQDLAPCVFSFQDSILKENVVVSSSCQNKVPQTGLLTQWKFPSSGCWRLEV